MKPMLRKLVNGLARRRAERVASVTVAESAQIDWRRIQLRPRSSFVVGDGSIFEGSVSSDRDGSCVVIGDRTYIGNSMLVSAERIEIGSDVLVSWGCTIVDHDSHQVQWSLRCHDVEEYRAGCKNWDGIAIRPVKIGNRAWIGFNVIILKGVQIGDGAVVAAGSVVTRDVAPFTLVAGNPARSIRSVSEVLT